MQTYKTLSITKMLTLRNKKTNIKLCSQMCRSLIEKDKNSNVLKVSTNKHESN